MIMLEIASSASSAMGEILIGYSVIRTHGKMIKHHRLDSFLKPELTWERHMVLVGMILILMGFGLKFLF